MRLIDADALMQDMKSNAYIIRDVFNSTDEGMSINGIQYVIDHAPTIVPPVTPTERTGKWITEKDSYEIICSKERKLAEREWIPVSERLPEDLEEVVVTWVNRNPPVYYRHEKDKPQTGIAVLYRDTWHWWDSTIVDVLAEYGSRCEIEHISEDIEIIAWRPLPEPYEGGDTE